MLRVRLEILAGGDERRTREIGRLELSNVTELSDISDYCYQLWTDRKCNATGAFFGHRRTDGAWELVRKVLNHMKRPQVAAQETPEAQTTES